MMTPFASIEVTRDMGTKIRRRGGTSSTSPMIRGRREPARTVATASRTLPSWSPLGSKAEVPVRRAMKTRVGALTLAGYRRWRCYRPLHRREERPCPNVSRLAQQPCLPRFPTW